MATLPPLKGLILVGAFFLAHQLPLISFFFKEPFFILNYELYCIAANYFFQTLELKGHVFFSNGHPKEAVKWYQVICKKNLNIKLYKSFKLNSKNHIS